MPVLQRFLLRWAPARVFEAAARRALREVPGIRAIEALCVERARGMLPRITATVRIAAGQDPAEVCRSAALTLYERVPQVELRILVSGERSPDGGTVVPLGPV